MKKMINRARVEGILYQHNLELKTSGPNSKHPGTEFISGTIDIATDDKMENIVPIHYTYVTKTTKKGTTNANFETLKKIIDGELGCYTNPEVLDKAAKVRVDTTIGLNDFYTNRNGAEELVSAKRCEGGFIHQENSISEDEKQRNTFELDIIITGVTEKEERVDDSGNVLAPRKADIDCRAFDYRNALLPMHLSAVNPKAIDYFLDLDVSKKEPVFTRVKGRIVSQQLVRQIHEESAFGEDSVREVRSSNRDYVITWAAVDPYEFDIPETITREELKKASQDRENYLATVKTRYDEYQSSKNNAIGGTAKPTVPKNDDDFDF